MRNLGLVVFFAALPALIAFGHDIYLFYVNYGLDAIERDLRGLIAEKGPWSPFASLGFIWTQYDEQGYSWVVENTDPETWAIINEILTYKAVVLGLVFAGFIVVLFGFLGLLGFAPLARERKTKNFRSGKKSGPMKYKRK